MSGYVLFRHGEHTFATPLDDVREIVRLAGVEPLPGAEPPVIGVLTLRGLPLPVCDVRTGADHRSVAGDCLVVDIEGDAIGVAVDRVVAVLQPHELAAAETPAKALPRYVTGVHRRDDGVVLMVDLPQLLATA